MQTASNTKMSFIVSPSTIRISEALLIGWMMPTAVSVGSYVAVGQLFSNCLVSE